MNLVVGELKALKERIVQGGSGTIRTMAEVIPNCLEMSQPQREQQQQQVGSQGGGGEDEHQQAVSLSRKTVGLSRIDKHDLERQRQEHYQGQ